MSPLQKLGLAGLIAKARVAVLLLCLAIPVGADLASDQTIQGLYERQQKGAERGDATDQYQLGLRYLNGEGVKRDKALALHWIRTAATNHDKEFPLSPVYRKEVDELFARLEGRKRPVETVDAKPRPKPDERNIITLTDRAGKRYENIEVVTIEPDGICYLAPDRVRMGKLKFADLPESVRARFGYNAAEAAKYEELRKQQTAQLEQQFGSAKAAAQKPQDDLEPAVPSVHAGTGFFVTDDGYLVTCFHVVRGATRIGIKLNQALLPASLVATDAQNDIALLKVAGAFHSLPVAHRGVVKLGDSVFTVGFPNLQLQGLEPKLTKGEINSLAGIRDDPRHFQISVAAQPGSSGGALVNSVGNVVGLVTMRLSETAALETSGMLPQNVNYALKCDSLISFLAGAPEVSGKLKVPRGGEDRKFDEVVQEVREATVLVIAGP